MRSFLRSANSQYKHAEYMLICSLSSLRWRIAAWPAIFSVWAFVAAAEVSSFPLEVLPPEHKRMTDPKTGAELLFLTTAPEDDSNLYFHEHSWLTDESAILFTSSRAT